MLGKLRGCVLTTIYTIYICSPNLVRQNSYDSKTFMPCPSTSPKMFCAGPNFWGSDQKLNFIQSCCKRFCASTKTINFLNANHLLLWQLISNLAENIWTSPNYFYTMTLPAGETYLSIKYNVHHLWPNLQK